MYTDSELSTIWANATLTENQLVLDLLEMVMDARDNAAMLMADIHILERDNDTLSNELVSYRLGAVG